MKTMLLAICLMISVITNSEASDKWTKTDVSLQAVYTVLHVIDWGQTLQISREPIYYSSDHSKRYMRREQNFVLGAHPKVDEVHKYFLSTLVLHTVISHVLPENYRTVWQGSTIALQAYVVGRNFSLGLNGFF
jgi:hypothetical protein